MTPPPEVSVVVPCFNGGQFLDALLANLAAQTYRDFEIIIVDDGSTDPFTRQKLRELESSVRVIMQENRYLPGARNTGFRAATGKFVLPLDCDDRLDPDYLSETVEAARRAPEDVAFVFTHMRLTGTADVIYPTRCNRFEQLFLNHLPYCFLIRRSAWSSVGGYDEAMRDGMEDWEFNIRLLAAAYRGLEIPKPLFMYNIRPEGMLLSKSARSHASIWHRIRRKHENLYRIPMLIAMWRDQRPTWLSTLRAAALYSAASLLPEAVCNALLFKINLVLRRLEGRPADQGRGAVWNI